MEHGKALLSLDVPKVIFLEPHVIDVLADTINASTNTTIIPFTKEEMEYWPERNRFLACSPPPGGSPSKDTQDFMIIMLNKVSWCLKASELNPYRTDLFTWIDFGINYILKGVSLKDAVTYLVPERVSPETIRIAGCEHFYPPYHPAQLVWKYCGGLFCGDVPTLKRMQTDQYVVVMHHLLDKQIVTWEVTIWYYMQASYMDRYIANHNATMFTNF